MTGTDYLHYREWKGWSEGAFGTCSRESAAYFAEELSCSGIEGVDGKTILEIGFGSGEFAAWCVQRGANYHGTEIIHELLTLAEKSGFRAHDGRKPLDELLETASVDILVAFDIFEHLELEALRTFLTRAFHVLRPSGRIIARVPSADSPFSGAIQNGDYTHRIAIGSSMVYQLASDSGFVVKSIREPAMPITGFGVGAFLRRSAVRIVRKLTFPVIDRVFMGGRGHVLSPTMVFVLVKP